MISFSEAIANELRHSGVTVTCFCPGRHATPVSRNAPAIDNSRAVQAVRRHASAEKVALDGYRAVMEGRTLAISGVHNWLVAQSTRFAPRKMVTAISRWVAKKPNSTKKCTKAPKRNHRLPSPVSFVSLCGDDFNPRRLLHLRRAAVHEQLAPATNLRLPTRETPQPCRFHPAGRCARGAPRGKVLEPPCRSPSVLPRILQDRRLDRPRTNHVDADLAILQVGGPATGKRTHRRLRRRIHAGRRRSP